MRSLTLLTTFLVVFFSTAHASPIADMKLAIQQQNYQQAYALAQQHPDYEGDPDFDYYYGLSAVQVGDFYSALFIFERLSHAYPEQLRYRVELARAHVMLQHWDAAEAHFVYVLSQQPPAIVVQRIEAFLQHIEQQRHRQHSQWHHVLRLGGGYDSNINSATRQSEIDVLDGLFTALLNKEQRETSSAFQQLSMMSLWLKPISKTQQFSAHVHGSYKHNQVNRDYDLGQLTGYGRFEQRHHDHRWSLQAGVQQLWLAERQYQQQWHTTAGWEYLASPHWQPETRLTLRQQSNRQNDDLDLTRIELNQSLRYQQPHWHARMTLLAQHDTNQEKQLARDTQGIQLSSHYQLTPRHALLAMAQWQQHHYSKRLPSSHLFAANERRHDDSQLLWISYHYQWSKQLGLFLQTSYQRSNSNIEIYDYNRTLIDSGLVFTF